MILGPLILVSSFSGATVRKFGRQVQIPPTETFTGEIMDSQCATVGTHDPMMKKNSAKDARDCTLMCARNGSFVLYDASTKTVYQLNDQEKPERFAGQRVKVSGPYDKKTETIDVESIEPLSAF